MKTENPSTPPLDTREAMLETLHMVYLWTLDEMDNSHWFKPRLSAEDQCELGRRLSQYWDMKTPQSEAVSTALTMTAESDARMNTYTPAQRAELEAEGRAMAAQGTNPTS